MIHGDIKPANIILTTAGEPKLADLGLAQFGGAANFEQATPLYISPEIALGNGKIDFRADIYSFGAMLYEMLAGEPPFFDLEPERVIRMHLEDEPEPLEKRLGFFDPVLSAFIDSMLAKKQENRPASWHKVTEFLRRYDIAAQLNET
jgi:serine/threonine-protein kinase